MIGLLLVLFLLPPDDGPFVEKGPPPSWGLPGDFLADSRIREHLDSGLTTTFLITATPRDDDKGLAETWVSIKVRFEPWDAVYLVSTDQTFKPGEDLAFNSFAALTLWWEESRWPLAERNQSLPEGPLAWRLELEVLPFSIDEQQRARDWVAASQARSSQRIATDGPGTRRPSNEGSRDAGIVNVMLATSIRQEALIRFQWRLKLL